MFLFSALLISPYMLTRMRRQTLAVLRNHKLYSAMIGMVSLITYLLILYALQDSSTPYVAALREVSIVLVAILGMTVLKEERNKRKIGGVAMIILGAAIIKLS
jgi:drug/metabolite transporter (DMT)-like permease